MVPACGGAVAVVDSGFMKREMRPLYQQAVPLSNRVKESGLHLLTDSISLPGMQRTFIDLLGGNAANESATPSAPNRRNNCALE